VLEGKPLDEAVRAADQAWSGSLVEDHVNALELLERQRDVLRDAMSGHLTPEQLADYLEVREDQFVELLRQSPISEKDRAEPRG
jgi:hypothetical protein